MGTTYQLTVDFGALIDETSASIHAAYVRTNLPAGTALIDKTATAKSVKLGLGRIDVPRTGGATLVTLLGTANTGLNVPANELRYEVIVEYANPGQKGLRTWSSGFFPLTANVNLKDVAVDVEPLAVTSASTYALEAKAARDSAAASAAQAQEVALGDAQAVLAGAIVNPGPVRDNLTATIATGIEESDYLPATFVAPEVKTTSGPAAPLPWLNVKDFGAKGDNATDDTAAFQAAVNALPASGGTVWAPAGKFIIAGTITIPEQKLVVLRGSGVGHYTSGALGTMIKRAAGSTAPVIAGATPSSANTGIYLDMLDLEITGADTAGTLVKIVQGWQMTWNRVRLSRTNGTLLHLTRAWNTTMTNVLFTDNGPNTTAPAVLLDGNAQGETNTMHFVGCEWERIGATHVKLTGFTAFGCELVWFTNCKWESKGAAPTIDLDNAAACAFSDCFIYKGSASDTGLLVKQSASGSSPVRPNTFTNCTFSHKGTAAPYFVEVLGGILQVANSALDGTPTTKYFHVGSAAGDHALKLANLHLPNPALLVTDDRATAATSATFGTLEGNSRIRGEVRVYNPTSGAGSGRVRIGTGAGVIYSDGTSMSFTSGGPTGAVHTFHDSAGDLLAAINADGSIQPGQGNTLGAKIFSGTGAPAISAAVGDMYIRKDGGAGTWLYRCTTAGSATTGAWTAVV